MKDTRIVQFVEALGNRFEGRIRPNALRICHVLYTPGRARLRHTGLYPAIDPAIAAGLGRDREYVK
jgi:hypothetical protein